ncbi:uncharacterized protein I303_103459 [Kwoniella dejecticola CBS 10117]|uniref:Gly-Xaa carboxypeptidase n=1 Tax=Kwoniella dejecticola CBS 10117 TaxID=1296121 RepID=A0A1A6A6T5_9TREE|nr:Gly-Xaa carboxypeptidase [Kwoniella dejecticola CBS 10117]OBR85770.1 Gly-Xaa carboxypeptidase [Kwoniella dejecticola CBS 10117]
MSEKLEPTSASSSLPLPSQTFYRGRNPSVRPKILLGILFILATLVNFGPSLKSLNSLRNDLAFEETENWLDKFDVGDLQDWSKCPKQPKALYPNTTWSLSDEEKKNVVDTYSRAVQIPTESFDDNGEPNEDPRWAPFFDFQAYLEDTFPLAHTTAKIEYINTLGILATFEGTDPSLKPLLLMSHYDVVPAPKDTYDRWTHPPFSGYNDGTYIWGRGAGDDKPLLVAQWEAITNLLENGFKPRRTVIFSHGNDEEEVFARRGQGHIAPFLEERYGKDGLLMVIDEGSGTIDDFYGAPFAIPGMGEKGYMDIVISVGTAGGHSSVPPKHSGIGIASEVVLALENNPFPTKLTPASPFLTSLQCALAHSPDVPKKYSKLLSSEGPTSYPELAEIIAKESLQRKALVGTTTAVDVIHGGSKVNSLPEEVNTLVNFRIDFTESINSTQHHINKLASHIAKQNGLKYFGFEKKDKDQLGGKYISIDLLGLPLEPAPRTPAEGGVWDLFAGTVKAVLPGPNGEERIVTPYTSTGKTDCKMYYNLTKNVYRFMGSSASASFAAHTVDEKFAIEGYLQIIRWVHAIIQNADAYTGEE